MQDEFPAIKRVGCFGFWRRLIGILRAGSATASPQALPADGPHRDANGNRTTDGSSSSRRGASSCDSYTTCGRSGSGNTTGTSAIAVTAKTAMSCRGQNQGLIVFEQAEELRSQKRTELLEIGKCGDVRQDRDNQES